MTKYLLKFTKEGCIRYISHLDLMRVFQRNLKRADIPVAYSSGFHPHPKISIAQPLSLGYLSCGEYIEIEIDEQLFAKINDQKDSKKNLEEENNAKRCCQKCLNEGDCEETKIAKYIKEHLNRVLPKGIKILAAKPIPQGKKSLAALVEYGEYEIGFMPETLVSEEVISTKTAEFFAQAEITVEKYQKKSGKYTLIDMKPLIDRFKIDHYNSVNNKLIMLNLVIKTGSISNLNPELLLNTYLQFIEIPTISGSIDIMRKDLFFLEQGNMRSLGDI